jgi:hypothetical protein
MRNAAPSGERGAIPRSRRLGRLAALDLLAIASVLVGCLVIFDSPSFLGFAVNGDTLHLALTVWDYSAHDYAREGFSMSRVPSIVPDIVVYSLAQLVTGSWRLASLAYGGLSLLGLAMAAGWIVRHIVGGSWRTATQAFLLLTLPVLMLELPITATSEHMHIFLPNNHGGPFILALAALGVAWDWLRRPKPAKLLLLFGLVAAGVLSDRLFIISCVGPIAAALGYAVLQRRISVRPAVVLVACLALGTLSARALELLLVKDSLYSIDWANASSHIRAFADGIAELATAAPLTALLAYGLPLLAFLGAPLMLRRRASNPGAQLAPVEFWWVLSAASISATLLATPLVYEGTWHYRYMMPLLWWPIIWTTALVVRISGAERSAPISAGLAGVTAVLAYAYFAPGLHAPSLLSLHHPLEACILEGQRSAGLKAGLGDYWNARYVEASSDWRLQIDQVEPDGSGMWWSNDRFWYTHDIHDGTRPPEYNYIIMTGLDEPAIRAHYGTPDRTIDCSGSAIWVYDDTRAVRRALVENSPPLYATFLDSGQGIDRICIRADRFLSPSHTFGPKYLAPLNGPLEIRADKPDRSRALSWGPGYGFGLPAGRWTVVLDYSLTSETQEGGRFQVSKGERVLAESALTPTDGTSRTARVDFELPAATRAIEIRSFLAGIGTIAIYGAKVVRAGSTGADYCAF